ncbi:PTS-dependent dihydroxyacetone kinase, ADP-binding subunit DhaL [Frondihabitans sp. 762G35]|uniref:dihydroxyacetone kinase subunit DhaL n=1 Tax=Frondihabitans sp. 762G35 TaxID=1446794 RepID=UPI000D2048DA|nr:dihydroxyacetone kinase subunit DhaL [Frondihabitans sp. 762G35]ARC56049.1 PTS-dependent dihydroxyacetone kinase, ADP-binding subunit DhaL [Frondihabitans sp. 762G35]
MSNDAIPTSPDDTRLEGVIRLIAQTCVDNEKYFSDLDAVAGDGDFGYSLARGFEVVLAEFDDFDRSDPGTFLQKVAMTMSSRIGGTSGPIWGTAFLRAAGVVKGHEEVAPADVVAMIRAAVEGIKKRGGADVGDKTLLDALVPVADALDADVAAGVEPRAMAQHAAEVARESAEATSVLQARRGRASYTGERSIGSPDPGAIAMAVLAERIAEEW